MTAKTSKEDADAALRKRLDELNTALGKQQSAQGAPEAGASAGSSAARTGGAMASGFRAMAELGGGVIVGGLIGWHLDKWFGTKPWALLVFFFLGTGAGFWNIYRIGMRPAAAPPDDGKAGQDVRKPAPGHD